MSSPRSFTTFLPSMASGVSNFNDLNSRGGFVIPGTRGGTQYNRKARHVSITRTKPNVHGQYVSARPTAMQIQHIFRMPAMTLFQDALKVFFCDQQLAFWYPRRQPDLYTLHSVKRTDSNWLKLFHCTTTLDTLSTLPRPVAPEIAGQPILLSSRPLLYQWFTWSEYQP